MIFCCNKPSREVSNSSGALETAAPCRAVYRLSPRAARRNAAQAARCRARNRVALIAHRCPSLRRPARRPRNAQAHALPQARAPTLRAAQAVSTARMIALGIPAPLQAARGSLLRKALQHSAEWAPMRAPRSGRRQAQGSSSEKRFAWALGAGASNGRHRPEGAPTGVKSLQIRPLAARKPLGNRGL